MANLVAMIFVVMVIVLGIGACWAITASGSATPTSTDTFGNTPPADTIAHNSDSSGLAISAMPVVFIAFFIEKGRGKRKAEDEKASRDEGYER